jgi:hypothetical protein
MSHRKFGHPEHVRLAFRAVRQYGMPAAIDQVCAHLQQLTEYQGAPRVGGTRPSPVPLDDGPLGRPESAFSPL